MRVIMSGGGTGGHIYPAIAIADRIKERCNKAQILFIGTERGLEKDIVPDNGYPIEFIEVSGLDRKNLLNNFKVIKKYLDAKKKVKKIIEDFKPDLVIGTGGYVSAPVVKMASKLGIKSYIHEQNAIAGVANKMLEKDVDNIFLGFLEAENHFKSKEKHIYSGNPVRDVFFKAKKEKSREILGFDEDDFVIFAFGGSQGAAKINRAIIDTLPKISQSDSIKLVFATGKRYFEPVLTEIKDRGIDIKENIEILEYIRDIHLYISAADIVISRSGALTVSEISVCGTPSILIPSPNVAGNHQMFNAKVLADRGGAVIVEEKNLDKNIIFDEISRLESDRNELEKMSRITKSVAPLDASDIIYYNVLK